MFEMLSFALPSSSVGGGNNVAAAAQKSAIHAKFMIIFMIPRFGGELFSLSFCVCTQVEGGGIAHRVQMLLLPSLRNQLGYSLHES